MIRMARDIPSTADMKFCAECGKKFFVMYPRMWVYARATSTGKRTWLCSWKCLRAYDKKEDEKTMGFSPMLTEEQKKKAVEIALAGGTPLPYLRECGSKKPSALWYMIKQKLDPDTLEKLPKKLPWPEKAETPENGTAPKHVETPEDAVKGPVTPDEAYETFTKYVDVKEAKAPEISAPVNYGGMVVREIEGAFGRYRRTDVNDKTYIDFEPVEDLDIMSYTVEQWRQSRKEQENAFAILGVAL